MRRISEEGCESESFAADSESAVDDVEDSESGLDGEEGEGEQEDFGDGEEGDGEGEGEEEDQTSCATGSSTSGLA